MRRTDGAISVSSITRPAIMVLIMQSCCTGKNLQMLLYLFALESYQRRAGTPCSRPECSYVPGRCDMVKLKPGEDPAQADAERQKDLRRKGLLLNDEAVLHAMEAYEKKPQYLPFAPGPDG